jgi:hypothetical protein
MQYPSISPNRMSVVTPSPVPPMAFLDVFYKTRVATCTRPSPCCRVQLVLRLRCIFRCVLIGHIMFAVMYATKEPPTAARSRFHIIPRINSSDKCFVWFARITLDVLRATKLAVEMVRFPRESPVMETSEYCHLKADEHTWNSDVHIQSANDWCGFQRPFLPGEQGK